MPAELEWRARIGARRKGRLAAPPLRAELSHLTIYSVIPSEAASLRSQGGSVAEGPCLVAEATEQVPPLRLA